MTSAKKVDGPARLLVLLGGAMPERLRPWAQALSAELEVIDGSWRRVQWSIGGATALVRACLRGAFEHSPKEKYQRLDVSVIAAYQWLFSVVLIASMTWQLRQMTERWRSAVPALIICYALALLPAIFGFGLVLRDESARVATIIFTIAHLFLNIEYLRRGGAPHERLTIARLAADLLIIFALTRQPVRHHFQLSPLALHLSDRPPGSRGDRETLP